MLPIHSSTAVALAVAALAFAPLDAPAEAAGAAPPPKASFRAAYEKALKAFDAGSYDDAIALFAKAYEIEPRAETQYMIGRCYDKRGLLEPAAAAYELFLRLAPDHPKIPDARAFLVSVLTGFGEERLARGDYVRAKTAFVRAGEVLEAGLATVGIGPLPALLAGLGDSLLGLGDVEGARAALSRAREMSMPPPLRERIEKSLAALDPAATALRGRDEDDPLAPPRATAHPGDAIALPPAPPPSFLSRVPIYWWAIGGGGVAVIVSAVIAVAVSVKARRPDLGTITVMPVP